MDEYERLSHTKWECKYHVVFIPKGRGKTLFGQLLQHLGEVFHKLAAQKESRIEEGHLRPDHVHMLISVPQIRSVASGRLIKGKSAIHIARVYGEGNEISLAKVFGLGASSSPPWGVTKPVIREYVKNQEAEDNRLAKLSLWC